MKYTVESGDTLSKIAGNLLGDSSRYMEIAQINGISNPDNIRVGQQLDIPNDDKNDSVLIPAAGAIAGQELMLTAQQLSEMMPDASAEAVERYLIAINQCLNDYQMSTPLRTAHFIAQVGHESGSFRYVSENLNYSAKALRSVFGKYFPDNSMAESYARQPEKIAGRVYADRMGNGSEASGDGWKYRGRGLIQLTGKDNYQSFSDSIDGNLLAEPDSVADNPELAVAAAGWFWNVRKLNDYADQDDVRSVTRRINGGYHGLTDRETRLSRAKQVLGYTG